MPNRSCPSGSQIKWQFSSDNGAYGIVTGGDSRYEWMLKWWWNNYRQHNNYPVYFADFGMSRAMREWCAQHGRIIPLTFKVDRNWFKKPLAILGTPFKRVFWIDLDCEIRGNLRPMFDFANNKIAVTLDPHNPWVKTKRVIATGVVGVTHGEPIMIDWAKRCMANTGLRGDQEVLNKILNDNKLWGRVEVMPPEWQWLRIDGDSPRAIIMHWTGSRGNSYIRRLLGMPPLARNIKTTTGAGRSKRDLRSMVGQRKRTALASVKRGLKKRNKQRAVKQIPVSRVKRKGR